MKGLAALRGFCTVIAFVILVGGYTLHQYHVWLEADPNVPQWTAQIETANLVLGWVLLTVGIVLALLRDRSDAAYKNAINDAQTQR